MSTAKEEVLFYFGEWNNKGINPANGCEIMFTSSGITIVCGDLACSVYMGMDADRVEWPVAARILKLDTPKAAEIQWNKNAGNYYGDGGVYLVKESLNHPGKYTAVHGPGGGVGDQALHDSLGAAKQACQDHKQKRLEALL